MGSRIGVQKVHARRLGIPWTEYLNHTAAGLKRCWRCRLWKTLTAFGSDRSRGDGHTPDCRDCKNDRSRQLYTPSPKQSRQGVRFTPRDGDKRQARRWANHLVDTGRLPDPDTVPCRDCGHLGDDRRHEYHHHHGYDAARHADVIPLCSGCHHQRDAQRKAA